MYLPWVRPPTAARSAGSYYPARGHRFVLLDHLPSKGLVSDTKHDPTGVADADRGQQGRWLASESSRNWSPGQLELVDSGVMETWGCPVI